MKKIIGKINPFSLKQLFFVYDDENGTLITKFLVNQNNFEEELFLAAEKYNIFQIDLTGPKKYNKGLKQRLEKTSKYNFSKIKINII